MTTSQGGLLLLVTLFGLLVFFTVKEAAHSIDQERSSQEWPNADCTVLSATVNENCHEGMCLYRASFDVVFKHPATSEIIHNSAYRYSTELYLDNHGDAAEFVRQFEIGHVYPCWYFKDSRNVQHVKLEQNPQGPKNKIMLVTVYFLFVTAVGVIVCAFRKGGMGPPDRRVELADL
jgi:hypothetical protein